MFAYARAGLGKEAGFVAGWMAMLDYLLIPAVAYLLSRRCWPVIWWRHVLVPWAGAVITVAVIVEASETAPGAAKGAGTGRVVTAGDGALSYWAVTLAAWL